MHYYKRNLGDYAKKAGRLSMLQHGAYTLLIDACYDREQFPTMDEAIDWCWASNEAEIAAVKFVLSKFFTLEDGVYVQKRIQEEIADYHAKSEINKRIANEREANRKKKNTKRERSVNEEGEKQNEPTPNQEPITINQEPITINQNTLAKASPSDVALMFDEFWQEYPKKRSKAEAFKAWKKIKSAELAALIISDVKNRRDNDKGWTDVQYVPNASTYLNNERWNDEFIPKKSSNHSGYDNLDYRAGVTEEGKF